VSEGVKSDRILGGLPGIYPFIEGSGQRRIGLKAAFFQSAAKAREREAEETRANN